MLEPGNIDLSARPTVKNRDGSISTVRSMSVNIDGREVVIPTVSDDGRIMSDNEAVQSFMQTGRHLGMFDNPQNATAFAQGLHRDQARLYGGNRLLQQTPPMPERNLLLQGGGYPR